MLILEGHDKQYLFERLNALRSEAAAAILGSEKHSKESVLSRGAKVERKSDKTWTFVNNSTQSQAREIQYVNTTNKIILYFTD